MGHAEFLEGGTDRREAVPCPFTAVEEVLRFDAVAEYGLPDSEDIVGYYERSNRAGSEAFPNQIYPGGYYKTVISGAIETFGWEMLLLAAADHERFARVLDSFFELTLHHVRAWARTSVEFFIQHDDFVWNAGAFLHPGFYRRAIIPHYKQLWQVLHEAGKIVLFCADGDWTQFVDDIAAAGADGFIFESITSLDYVAERYGGTRVIMGSKVDCRTLTFGTPEEIAAEIDATLSIAQDCPGFVFAIGNHVPSNVPVDNALFYFDYLRRRWRR
jgi:uroporphyrinogen-III decarboxylase